MKSLDQARPDVGEELVSSRGGRGRWNAGGDELRPYMACGRVLKVAVALAVALLAGAGEALACAVCYGQAQGDVISGAKLSIVFLGALVYVLMGGGVAVLLALRRRVRRNLDPHRGLRLVHTEPRSP